MAIDFDAEVLVACMDEFGEAITHTPAIGDAYTIAKAIYTAAAVLVTWHDGVPVNSVAPTIGARLADFQVAPLQDDRITAGGKDYRITRVDLDSIGHVLLILARAPA